MGDGGAWFSMAVSWAPSFKCYLDLVMHIILFYSRTITLDMSEIASITKMEMKIISSNMSTVVELFGS